MWDCDIRKIDVGIGAFQREFDHRVVIVEPMVETCKSRCSVQMMKIGDADIVQVWLCIFLRISFPCSS